MADPTPPPDVVKKAGYAETCIHNCDQRSPFVELRHPALPRGAVRVEQRGSTHEGFKTGTSSVLWPVAMRLARHLCDRPELVRGKEVLELGAGIGIVGAAAGALGARRTVITDCDEGMPLLESTREKLAEDGVSVEVARVNWGEEVDHKAALRDGPGFEVLLASDVVVPGFDTDRLCASCVALLRRAPESRLLLAYEFRGEWESVGYFLHWAAEAGLDVAHQTLDEDGNEEDSEGEGEHWLYTIRWKQ